MERTLRRAAVLRTSQARRGATSVEMALVLPIVFVLIMGGIEFARLNIIRHVTENASYEACRYVVVPGGNVSEAQTKATQMMQAVGVTNATVTVTPNPILETTTKITVHVDVPCAGNFWFLPQFSAGKTVSAETTLMAERPPIIQIQAIGP